MLKTMGYFDLANQLTTAGQNHQWSKVLEICQTIDTQHPDIYDSWKNYWHARALAETGNLFQALEIAARTHRLNPVFEANNNLLRYIVRKFMETVKPNEIQDTQLQSFVEVVNNLGDNDLYTDTMIRLAKKYHSAGLTDVAISLLETIDRNTINTQRRQTANGKILSLAESYALALSKLYLIKKQPQDALAVIDWIFNKIQRLDHNAEKLLKEKQAQAFIQAGDYDQAIKILSVLVRKNEARFLFLYAQALEKNGYKEPAFFYAIQALLDNRQKPWYKIKMYLYLLENFYDWIDENHRTEIARFIIALYKDNGFPNSKVATNLAVTYDVSINKLPDSHSLKQKVDNILHSRICPRKIRGKIINLRKNFGFIRDTDGKTYYFHFSSVKDKDTKLSTNQEVEFCKGWNYDMQKGQIKEAAYSVKILKK